MAEPSIEQTRPNSITDRTKEQVDIVFDAGLRTFCWTVERSRHFDIKASITLAFLGILLLPGLEIYSWSSKNLLLRLIPIIIIASGTFLCLFAILPRIHLEHPSLDVIKKDYEDDKGPIVSKMELFAAYKKASENNAEIGAHKISLIWWAQLLSIVAFYVIVINYLFRGVFYGKS